MKKIHNFKDSLKKAENPKFDAFWEEVYRKFFVNFKSMGITVTELALQKKGVDRLIYLKSNKVVAVDEKIRFSNYEDILLEYWSSFERKTKGWIEKDMLINFLCYAFIDQKKCYIFEWEQLQKTWFKNKKEWVLKYKIVKAKNKVKNKIYTTVSVAIPIDVLMHELSKCSTIQLTKKSL